MCKESKYVTIYIAHLSLFLAACLNLTKQSHVKAQDILSPDCRRKKTEHTIVQKEYSDDRLPSSWIEYRKTVRNCYILFVFMVCSFSACSPGLVYPRP